MATDADLKENSSENKLGFTKDWPDQATDLVVDTVDKIRSVSTGPIVSITRILSYIVFSIFPLLLLLILGIIAAVRGLEIVTGQAWAAHGILGLCFTALGLLCWSRRPH